MIDSPPADSTTEMAPVTMRGDPLEQAWVRAQVHRKMFGSATVVHVDRFELRARIGTGAMGAVWEAHDPDLARDVAIKILFDSDDPDVLRREAQAMAKLRHPNVVAVHEVGTWNDLPYVAMERVAGPTIRAWLAAEPRSVAAIVAIFRGAGQGLAAAHAVGLVHRDFKPDNVLVDSTGLARVADFGLARETSAIEAGRAGTPAYMAPELASGEPATPRADQYAFCVALYEALHGGRPPVAKPRAIPRALAAAITRGLEADPAKRHADMNALLAALDPARPRGWLLPGAIGILTIAAVAIVATRSKAPPIANARIDLCGGGEAALGWTTKRRAEIHDALAKSPRTFAATAATQATAALDDYATRWTAMYRASCEATRVYRAQPEDVLGMRQACLDDRRRYLDALGTQLAAHGAELADVAMRSVAGLPAIERCADLAALRARKPPPKDPAVGKEVDALRDRLASARAEYLAGHYPAAVAAATAILVDAKATAYAPLTAEVELLLGQSAARAGDDPAATAALQHGYEEAIAGGDDVLAADVAIAQAFAVGYLQRNATEGHRLAGIADAQVRRAGESVEQRAALANVRGNLADTDGNYEVSRAEFAKAHEGWAALPGDHRIDIGGALQNEGNALRYLGRHADARARLDEASKILGETLGADHPAMAMLAGNLAVVMRAQGERDAALASNERALAIDRVNFGDAHPNVGQSLGGVGIALLELGRPADARDKFREAQKIFVAKFGDKHPLVAGTLSNIGLAEYYLHDLEHARADLEAALAMKAELRGPTHASLATTLDALGDVALARGDAAGALAAFERSLAISTTALGADSPELATELVGIGRAKLAQSDRAAATSTLERAVKLRAAPGTDPVDLALAQYYLARATNDRPLATTALAIIAKAPAYGAVTAEAAAWLK